MNSISLDNFRDLTISGIDDLFMELVTASVTIIRPSKKDEPTLEELYRERIPNETTLKALRQIEEDEGWLSFDTPEDLFEYLDNC
jgi:hypothetical protein